MHYPSNSEQALIDYAAKVALHSRHWRCRHSCVIKRAGHIVGGYNKFKNLAFVTYQFSTVHAEIDALNKHSHPRGAIAVNVRLDPAGGFAYAYPCPACETALQEAGIKKILYSDHHGFGVLKF